MSLVEWAFVVVLAVVVPLTRRGAPLRRIAERRERAEQVVTEFILVPDLIPSGLKNPPSPNFTLAPATLPVAPEATWLLTRVRLRVAENAPRCFAVEADVEKRAILRSGSVRGSC